MVVNELKYTIQTIHNYLWNMVEYHWTEKGISSFFNGLDIVTIPPFFQPMIFPGFFLYLGWWNPMKSPYRTAAPGPFGLCIRDNGSFVCSPGRTEWEPARETLGKWWFFMRLYGGLVEFNGIYPAWQTKSYWNMDIYSIYSRFTYKKWWVSMIFHSYVILPEGTMFYKNFWHPFW